MCRKCAVIFSFTCRKNMCIVSENSISRTRILLSFFTEREQHWHLPWKLIFEKMPRYSSIVASIIASRRSMTAHLKISLVIHNTIHRKLHRTFFIPHSSLYPRAVSQFTLRISRKFFSPCSIPKDHDSLQLTFSLITVYLQPTYKPSACY